MEMEVLAGNISYMNKNEVSNLIDTYRDLTKSNPRKALVSAQDAYAICTNLDFEEGKIKALIVMGEKIGDQCSAHISQVHESRWGRREANAGDDIVH